MSVRFSPGNSAQGPFAMLPQCWLIDREAAYSVSLGVTNQGRAEPGQLLRGLGCPGG